MASNENQNKNKAQNSAKDCDKAQNKNTGSYSDSYNTPFTDTHAGQSKAETDKSGKNAKNTDKTSG